MLDKLENCLVGIGLAMGIANIETILGIALVCIQISIILGRTIVAIIDKVKNKDYNGIEEDLRKTEEEMKEYYKYLEELDKKNKEKESDTNGEN